MLAHYSLIINWCLLHSYKQMTQSVMLVSQHWYLLHYNTGVILYYAPRKISGEHIVAALSVRPSVRQSVSLSVRQSVRTSHSCPAHNFVIWSRISKLFYRNDLHVETTCRAQHLGTYLEGQGHSTTLQQNLVRPITLLLEVRFRKYFTEMITTLTWRVARNIWVPTLKVKVTARPCSKIVSGQ